MTSFFHTLNDTYAYLKIGINPEIDSWPFMKSPVLIFTILIVYLLFVLWIGPKIMKNRSAMELRKSMIAYNGFQVVFSIFIVNQAIRLGMSSFTKPPWETHQDVNNVNPIIGVAWWYMIGKITELLDTVFFVLRKQTRQITFLHVYHHSIMVSMSWWLLKYTAPVQQGLIAGMVNSIVHVIMYTYYMIAAMGPKYKKYIWWKKYVTIIQLVQFFTIIFFLVLLSFSKYGYHKSTTYFFLVMILIFLVLFFDFYRKEYVKKGNKKNVD